MICYTGEHAPVRVFEDRACGFGGLATVYVAECEGRTFAAKIIVPGQATDARREKIKLLMRIGRANPGIPAAFPVEVLYDRDNVFCGYLMRYLEGESLAKVAHSEIDARGRVRISLQVMRLLENLHGPGVDIVVGDVHLSNFLYAKGIVWLLDLDSVTCADREKRVVYATAETLHKSPEMKRGLRGKTLTAKSDAFLSAEVIFEVLFATHPLDEPSGTDIAETAAKNMLARRFAYAYRHDALLPLNFYGAEVAALFGRTFERGAEVDIPSCKDYVSALTWVDFRGYKTCPKCGSTYPRLAPRCPGCK